MEIIAKGEEEVKKFLEDVETGKYNTHPVNGNDLFPESNKSNIKQKITKKDVQPINSFRTFKKVAKNIDVNQLDGDKANFFKWLCKMMNNELTEESITRYFK